MPSKRKLHVGRGLFSWCQRAFYGDVDFWITQEAASLRRYGPPDLSADPRVCKRCVKAMDKAHKEAQR